MELPPSAFCGVRAAPGSSGKKPQLIISKDQASSPKIPPLRQLRRERALAARGFSTRVFAAMLDMTAWREKRLAAAMVSLRPRK